MSNSTSPPVVQSGLRFEDFQVVEAHFKSDPAFKNEALTYTLNFIPSGRLSRAQGRFMLRLGIDITTNTGLFEANVQALGHFSFDPEGDPDSLDKLLTLNTVAIVFPYVRAYIGSLTALSGLPTVLAPTYNLISLAEPLRQAIEEVEEV
jgi:preprotein translocase subunit SecB